MAALRLAFIFCAAVGLLAPAASALDGQQPPGGVLFVKVQPWQGSFTWNSFSKS